MLNNLIRLVLGRQQKKKNEVIDIRQGLQSTQFQVFLGCCSVRIWVSGSCLGWEPDREALRVGKKRRQTGNWLFHRVKLESRIVYTHGQRSSPGQKSGRKEGKKVRLFLGATCAYFAADAWLPVNRAKKHSETGPRLSKVSRTITSTAVQKKLIVPGTFLPRVILVSRETSVHKGKKNDR